MVSLSRIALVACASAALAGCAVQVRETDEYAEAFAPAGADRVVFEGLDGDIVLRGMEEVSEVEIHGTQSSVGATRQDARQGLKYAVLDAGYASGDLELSFSPPFSLEGLVDLELDRVSTLPRGMGVAAAVEAGDIEISGLDGALDLETGHGDIDVDDFGTALVRATAGGDIRYSVGLVGVGFYIECDATGGDVVIDDALIDAGAVQETDADGTIVLTFGDALKRVELTTTRGGIDVSLNAGAP